MNRLERRKSHRQRFTGLHSMAERRHELHFEKSPDPLEERRKLERSNTASDNSLGLIEKLRLIAPKRVEPGDTDAVEAWMSRPPRTFVFDTDKQSGRFTGYEEIIDEERRVQVRHHDAEGEQIGLHFAVFHAAFPSEKGSVLGYKLAICGPAEPGTETEFNSLEDCADKDWLSPEAAVVAQYSIIKCAQELRTPAQ